jgi:regulator of replication initiation timing
MNPECTSFDTFQKSVLDVLDTLKEDLSKCKLSYDLLCHENTRLKLENERMKENEIDMLRASTVVNALNENHNLREEVRLLKGSLRKALSQNRSTMNASKDPHLVPEAEEKPVVLEEEEEEKPVVPEEKPVVPEEEKPVVPEEEEKPVVMDIMTFKKISYYIDVEGRMYAMNADSTVGDMVGNARSVNGKYKVKFLNK